MLEKKRLAEKKRLRIFLLSYEKEVFQTLEFLSKNPRDRRAYDSLSIAIRDRNRATIDALATKDEWECDDQELSRWRLSISTLRQVVDHARAAMSLERIREKIV